MTMAGGGGLDVKRTEGLMRRLCLVLDQWRLAVVKGNHQLAAIVAQLYPLADQGQQRNQRGQIRPPSVPKQCCGARSKDAAPSPAPHIENRTKLVNYSNQRNILY